MKIIKFVKNNKIQILFLCIVIGFLYYNKVDEYNLHKNPNEKKYDIILKWFNNLSEKHNINYSLAYGTLLGYIRNKKYIPYDLDMDMFISKDDTYKIIDLIDNKQILYNVDIKNIGGLNKNKIYIIINKSHNNENMDETNLIERPRYNCKGDKVKSQVDSCSQNILFARVIYNNIHCDLFVYGDDVYIPTYKGKILPKTKRVKFNNITTKIFESDEFINDFFIKKYGKNYLIPDHKYINGKWTKI
jgi:hypothetical protein